MSDAHFIYIADIYCPWCYGFAPIMQRLAEEHPQFPVRVIGGNLMSQKTDLTTYADNDPELAEFWHEVEGHTGRSLAGALSLLKDHINVTMYSPGADLILMALEKLAPGHALDQLVFLENMFYGKGMDLFTVNSLRYIADRWGVDARELALTTDSQDNQENTMHLIEEGQELMGEITAYPSVLLVRGQKVDAVSRGFVRYETVAQRLEDTMLDLGLEELPDIQCTWHGSCHFGRKSKK